jgi:hypothetical protein
MIPSSDGVRNMAVRQEKTTEGKVVDNILDSTTETGNKYPGAFTMILNSKVPNLPTDADKVNFVTPASDALMKAVKIDYSSVSSKEHALTSTVGLKTPQGMLPLSASVEAWQKLSQSEKESTVKNAIFAKLLDTANSAHDREELGRNFRKDVDNLMGGQLKDNRMVVMAYDQNDKEIQKSIISCDVSFNKKNDSSSPKKNDPFPHLNKN